jgi:hypothetical protein
MLGQSSVRYISKPRDAEANSDGPCPGGRVAYCSPTWDDMPQEDFIADKACLEASLQFARMHSGADLLSVEVLNEANTPSATCSQCNCSFARFQTPNGPL